MSEDLAASLVEHVLSFPAAALSDEVSQHLGLDLADSLAVTLGGSRAEGIAALQQIIQQQYQSGQARVVNSKLSLPAVAAAQLNASAGHALDYDDTLDEGGGMHAGALLHNAVLAVADELGNVSGADYSLAVALGLDVAVRLALAPTQDFGWHRTSAFGIFGVVAALGRLLKLDHSQLRNAFGIAYSQASGNRQCILDGALSKRLQAGFAARDGITAVLLARAGLTGAQAVFEGPDGFFNLYQRGAYRPDVITEGLGTQLLSARISLKPYPCGRNVHALLDASLAARPAHQGRSIQSIQVYLEEAALARNRTQYPKHSVQAQFSIPFSLALSTLSGQTRLQDYAAPQSASDAVKALAAKVELRSQGNQPSRLVFVYDQGGSHTVPLITPSLGHPHNPLTATDIRRKLWDCNAFAHNPLRDETLEQLLQNSLSIRNLANTQTLTRLLQIDH